MAIVFDLTQNPFHLLGLSVRARREEVVEAHEDALTDGRTDEDVLVRAQQTVLSPRTRTGAELSWLLSVPPSQVREILSKLEQKNFPDAQAALKRLQGLDKANLAADLCVRSDGEVKYVQALLKAYEDFTAENVLQVLVSLRSVSGFPRPDQKQIVDVLADLRVIHAKAAVACTTASGSPGETLTEIVETFLTCSDDNVAPLLDRIVREYDAWSQPHLGTIKERIELDIAACRSGGDQIPAVQLVKLLVEWDYISQPVQLLEESKGHEERRSKEVYEIVRDFCLWLANENSHYEEALIISRALLKTFPELPAVAAQLSQDVDALESLAEEAKSLKLMGPLIETTETAKTMMSAFDEDVIASNFGPKSRGLAKGLYDVFVDVAARTDGTKLADMPWMVVRGLAIDLNNEHDSPKGACAILDGLIAHKGTTPSDAVVEKLRDDKRSVFRSLKWEELNRISDDVPKGIALVSELLDGADADERAALLQLKTALKRKRATTVSKRVFWGLAASAFVGFLIYDTNKEPAYTPRSSPTTAYTSSTSRVSTSPSPAQSSEIVEKIPAPGTDRVLNRSEVRYCIFQGKRLDILRGLVSTNAETDRFNRLVNDFNSRCSSFRYRQGVLRSIEAEVPVIGEKLQQEAERLFTSWRRSSSSSSVIDDLVDIDTVSGASLIQSRLKKLGYYGGVVDGIWGPASRRALSNFKSSQSGLLFDDEWDIATQRALLNR